MVNFASREIPDEDAQGPLRLQQRLDGEAETMMLEPGERDLSVEAVASHVRETLAAANSTIIVADSASQLVGYVEAEGGKYRRRRHSAYVVIGVLRAWHGRASAAGCWRRWTLGPANTVSADSS